MTSRGTVGAAAWALVAALVAAGPSAAQAPPDRSPPAKETPAPRSDEQTRGEREAMRARLRDRLEEVERQREAMQEALKALDDGAALEDVRQLAFPARGRDGGPVESDRPRDRLGGEGGGGGGVGGDGPTWRQRVLARSRAGDSPQVPPIERVRDPKVREAIHDILRQTFPELKVELDLLAQRDSDAADRKMAELFPRLEALIDLRDDDPDLYTSRVEEMRLGRQAAHIARHIGERLAEGSAAAALDTGEESKKLRDIVGRVFDLRLDFQRRELADLERRHEGMRDRIRQQEEQREQIVDRLTADMIDRARRGAARSDREPGGVTEGAPRRGDGRRNRGERAVGPR